MLRAGLLDQRELDDDLAGAMKNSVSRFYRWLKWRAGADGQCHWSQARMAKEFNVTDRTIRRWLDDLQRANWIAIRHRSQRSAVVTIRESYQSALDFSAPCKTAVENSRNVRSHVRPMSGQMSGHQRCNESLESLESLKPGIDDRSPASATTIKQQ